MDDAREYNTGVKIEDLLRSQPFASRPVRPRSTSEQLDSLQRLSRVLVDDPERVLQELVQAAREMCNADSAGISLEATSADGVPVFHWAALTGTYESFRDATPPQAYMPCLVCINEQRPQVIHVPSRHFSKLLSVDALPITDGLLLPWNAEGQRATIWVLAHERAAAFDMADYQIMQALAAFAATAYNIVLRHRQQLSEAVRLGSAAMANDLAHRINNPLQSVTNSLFLAQGGGPQAADHTMQAALEVERLSGLVRGLLAASKKPVVH
jgi:hypothetical protein